MLGIIGGVVAIVALVVLGIIIAGVAFFSNPDNYR